MEQVESLRTENKFKKTEAGEIPVDWEVVKIRNISSICRGASPRPIGDPNYFGNGPGWIRISDVTKANIYLRETEDHLSELGVSKSVCVKRGDLIMSICATIGKPVIVDMDACIHDGFVLFDRLSKQVDSMFLLFWLQKNSDYFVGQGQHGTQKNLNTSIIKDTKIALPPFVEQKKIAEILSRVDQAIEKSAEIIEKTEELKKGLMQELLTRGIGHKKFKKTKIGEIPENWEIVQLKKLINILPGFPFDSKFFADKAGLPLIRIRDLERGYTETYFVGDYDASYLINKGDLLIGMDGEFYVVLWEGEQALLNQRICKAESLNTQLNQLYLYYWLGKAIKAIEDMTLSTTVKHLSTKDINKIIIPLPSKSEQEKIADILSSVDKQIEKETSQRERLEVLKKGLMQVLLTGKVRVK